MGKAPISKAEAEARGWIIVHERDEYDVSTAATETRTIAASYRAEKYVNDVLINEEAETIGLLLERIYLKEQQLDAANVEKTVVPIPEDRPLDEAGIEQRHVIVATEPQDLSNQPAVAKISDAELTSRARTDAVLVNSEDGPVMLNYRPTDDALAADEAAASASRAVEDRRTREPLLDEGSTERLVTSNADAVDSPGIGAGSDLIVRKDDEGEQGFRDRRAVEDEQNESDRVQRQTEIGFHPAPEGEEKLAGVGVSIRDRAALGSEVPRQGQTADAAEAIKENDGSNVEMAPDVPSASVGETRSDAVEQAAKDQRDDAGPVEASDDAHAADASAAGEQAVQEQADQAAEPQEGQPSDSGDDHPASAS